MSIHTTAVHAGRIEMKPGEPSATPIVTASSWRHADPRALDEALGSAEAGYVYSRNAAPTQEAFEAAMAALEGAAGAAAFASGMAALHAAILTASGEHPAAGAGQPAAAGQPARQQRPGVVAATELYGATRQLLEHMQRAGGLPVTWVNIRDLESVEQALRARPGAVLLFEVISNPLCRLADVQTLARMARRLGARSVVDATFATPYLIRPLTLGADFVAHSATKYIGGHGDVLAGIVCAAEASDAEALRGLRMLLGSNLGAFDAFLALRGLRTLPLRVREQNRNALGMAQWLAQHPRVGAVYYPGLEGSPDRALAERQLRAGCFGGMLAFEILRAERNDIFNFLNKLQVFQPLPTLGDAASLAAYPAHASHRNLSPDQRAALGISDACLRLSAGIEDLDDLIGDLAQALT